MTLPNMNYVTGVVEASHSYGNGRAFDPIWTTGHLPFFATAARCPCSCSMNDVPISQLTAFATILAHIISFARRNKLRWGWFSEGNPPWICFTSPTRNYAGCVAVGWLKNISIKNSTRKNEMMNANTLNKYDINGCVKSMDFMMMMMMVISWLRSVGRTREEFSFHYRDWTEGEFIIWSEQPLILLRWCHMNFFIAVVVDMWYQINCSILATI